MKARCRGGVCQAARPHPWLAGTCPGTSGDVGGTSCRRLQDQAHGMNRHTHSEQAGAGPSPKQSSHKPELDSEGQPTHRSPHPTWKPLGSGPGPSDCAQAPSPVGRGTELSPRGQPSAQSSQGPSWMHNSHVGCPAQCSSSLTVSQHGGPHGTPVLPGAPGTIPQHENHALRLAQLQLTHR